MDSFGEPTRPVRLPYNHRCMSVKAAGLTRADAAAMQGRLAAVLAAVATLIAVARHRFTEIRAVRCVIAAMSGCVAVPTTLVVNSSAAATCTTGS